MEAGEGWAASGGSSEDLRAFDGAFKMEILRWWVLGDGGHKHRLLKDKKTLENSTPACAHARAHVTFSYTVRSLGAVFYYHIFIRFWPSDKCCFTWCCLSVLSLLSPPIPPLPPPPSSTEQNYNNSCQLGDIRVQLLVPESLMSVDCVVAFFSSNTTGNVPQRTTRSRREKERETAR